MGGGGDTQKQQTALSKQQVAQGEQSQKHSSQLFDTTYPWLQKSGQYFSGIASGDPGAIQKEIAPAAEKISTATTAAERNIDALYPRGGARDLAKQEAEIGKAGQIGQLATTSYTGAQKALAAMGGSGLGISISEMANAIAGLGQGAQTLGQVGQEKAANKASTMGFLGSLSEAGGAIAGAAVGKN